MKLYADRMFIEVNGNQVADCMSAEINADESLSTVDTMTSNYRSAGYKKGNKKVTIKMELAITRKQAQIDMALADDDAEINVVAICGGERYIAKDCAQASMGVRGSTGDASKSLDLMALDLVNQNGDSVNAVISLG
jgi:hypothetical protein